MELADVDADGPSLVRLIEDISELGSPDDFVGGIGRPRMHVLRERLVEAVEKDEKLDAALTQILLSPSPQRAALIDRVNDGPGERKKDDTVTLELERDELAIGTCAVLLSTGHHDRRSQLDDLVLLLVDQAEHEGP